jgi:hypothetical protein
MKAALTVLLPGFQNVGEDSNPDVGVFFVTLVIFCLSQLL